MIVPPDLMAEIKKGTCVRCGSCCRTPPAIEKEEGERIAKFLNITLNELKDNYLRWIPDHKIYVIRKTGPLQENPCIFLNKTKIKLLEGEVEQCECSIHAVKPVICQMQMCGYGPGIKKLLYQKTKELLKKDFKWVWI